MAFIDTRLVDPKQPLPDWPGRFFNSETMTFAYYDTIAGASIHPHSHPNEEVWHVIDGELEVTIGDEVRRAGPGCVAIVPPDVVHAVSVITAGRVIVVDHPTRDSIGGVRIE